MNWADEMEEWRESEYGEDRDRTLEGSHRSGSHSSPDWLGGTERNLAEFIPEEREQLLEGSRFGRGRPRRAGEEHSEELSASDGLWITGQ